MSQSPFQLGRREFVASAAVVAAGAVISQSALAQDHAHHQMTAKKYQALIDAALNCVKAAEACNDHCLDAFKEGDKSLAACHETSLEASAACILLAKYASWESSHLKGLAAFCKKVCETCAKECEVHAKKHPTCKDCFDACQACAKECAKVA